MRMRTIFMEWQLLASERLTINVWPDLLVYLYLLKYVCAT